MAIELDDASHRTPRPPYRARRDAFKDQVLADAGIPVLRIPTAEAYSPEDLAEKITTFLTRRTPQTPPQV
jgi:very-short-patch-repair endonuclease